MRLRVNRNCHDCSSEERKKLQKIKNKIKEQYPQPSYMTKCIQCKRVVYEKSEDIPDGVDGANGPWQVDHDHETGKFRGHICKLCNTGTGMIGDTEEFWKQANEIKNGNK